MDVPTTGVSFRVWPDGTVQEAAGGQPYSWMSDDFMVVQAEDESAALEEALRREASGSRPGA